MPLDCPCMLDAGQLFPDTDPKWKGARSDIFLNEAVRERGRVGARGPRSSVPLANDRQALTTGVALALIILVCVWQVRLMEERGYTLGNIDCTIIAQKPKLSPHKVGHWLLRLLCTEQAGWWVVNSVLGAAAHPRAPVPPPNAQENIRTNLCRMLKADPSVVNVKAKTHEKVDSIGEERSIGCHAVVMLIRK